SLTLAANRAGTLHVGGGLARDLPGPGSGKRGPAARTRQEATTLPDRHVALLAAAARRYPDRPAVAGESGTVSYRELAAGACRVAAALARHGVARGHRVGVVGHRDAPTVAAIHGVLASGAAYVPVDADWPAPRQAAV